MCVHPQSLELKRLATHVQFHASLIPCKSSPDPKLFADGGAAATQQQGEQQAASSLAFHGNEEEGRQVMHGREEEGQGDKQAKSVRLRCHQLADFAKADPIANAQEAFEGPPKHLLLGLLLQREADAANDDLSENKLLLKTACCIEARPKA